MYILRVIIFSLDEPNLTRILTVFKENLVKCKGKITTGRCSVYYPFIPNLFFPFINWSNIGILIVIHTFINLIKLYFF